MLVGVMLFATPIYLDNTLDLRSMPLLLVYVVVYVEGTQYRPRNTMSFI